MIKDVMVHLDGGPEDTVRIAHAEALAARDGAHLKGLYTNRLPDYGLALPMDAGAAAAQALADAEQETRGAGEAIHRQLQERFSRLTVPNEVRALHQPSGLLASLAAREALCADIFVVTRPYGVSEESGWGDLMRSVLFGSGRALLVVPPRRRPQGPIRTVMVAWQDTREAARALREALPFIEQATRTVLVLVDPDTEDAEPEADVVRHLARHTARVEAVRVAAGERTTAEALLDEARRASADLVVMGGYGHSRIAEWVMGGVTVDMLFASPYPLLMAH